MTGTSPVMTVLVSYPSAYAERPTPSPSREERGGETPGERLVRRVHTVKLSLR